AYMAKEMLKTQGVDIPIVTTLHGTDITLVGNHPFYKPAVTFSINKSDVVTSVSKSLKDDTNRLFDIEKNIHVIPNFIDLTKYKKQFADCGRSIMAADHERIITHVSNFRKVKRIDDVIKVFHGIQKVLPARLIMVGEGPEKENAEEMCQKLGIADKVAFLGNSNEVDKILCYSDLFLLPSETESFGLAALEAMVNEVPVISSDTGGIPEVNKHGVSGFLSPVGAVDEMIENSLYILSDDQRLDQFKIQARNQASIFDINYVVPLYEEIYEIAYNKLIKGQL